MQSIDENIVKQINRGNAKAFEKLYNAYYVYLCAVATKYIYRAEAAEEIVNNVFLNVWERRETLIYPPKAYLIRSVQNRSLNYIRQQKLEFAPLSEVQEHLLNFGQQQIIENDYPLTQLENKELEAQIYNAIQKLPPKCRDIFVEYVYNNLSYEEIAQLYNISSSTVRGQIKIGLGKLKDQLGENYLLFLFLFELL